MIIPTEEEINAFNMDIKDFFDTLCDEKKWLSEDLRAIELPLLGGKICDFGCGFGHTTFCLMSILGASEAIGIDIDPNVIKRARLWFEAVKYYIEHSTEEKLSDSEITNKLTLHLE